MTDNFSYELLNHQNLNLPIQYVVHRAGENIDIPMHWHEAVEINYVVSGTMQAFEMNGQTFTVSAGEYVVVNSGTLHQIKQAPSDLVTMTLLFQPEFFAAHGFDLMQRLFFRTPLRHDTQYGQRFAEVMLHLYQIVEATTLNTLQFHHAVYEIADILVHDFSYLREDALAILAKPGERIYEMIHYIKVHDEALLTPHELARVFHVSPSYLARYFKQQLNMTPNQYLQLQRLQHAQTLLANTDHAISWIADAAGFVSEKSLQRIFRKYYAMSPRDYRKMVQKTS
jgi:AraC-like DNA-binding protein/quercetin dioxygenase-like cupin family protein